MKKSSIKDIQKNRGITLIALVITIIVLLILAGISIAMLTGENGLLTKVGDARIKNEEGEIKEEIALAWNSVQTDGIVNNLSLSDKAGLLKTELEKNGNSADVAVSGSSLNVTYRGYKATINTTGGGITNFAKETPKDPSDTPKVADSKGTKFDTNTELEDTFGNKITVPEGFKIASESPDNVTGGIVIEDADSSRTTEGSQFVWIPVGDVYTDTNGTKTNIELCRCGFNGSGEKVSVEEGWEYQITKMIEGGMPSSYADQYRTYTFTEETESREGSTSENKNATAKNLNDFRTKASKGYYIGRYEARKDSNGNVTEKASDSVYNNVTQLQASNIARNMYTSSNFDSDLVNSYAWDTAILFLQQFDDRTDKTTKYSLQTSLNNSLATTGTTTDKICNIYDMASNCFEWTTETCSGSDIPCVIRGGRYHSSYNYASARSYNVASTASGYSSFRSVLYVK